MFREKRKRIVKPQHRRGVTAVEFAIVFPIALTMIFGLLEISRLYQIDGAITTALIKGGREASILTSEAVNVRQEVSNVLTLNGIREPVITVSPANLNPTTTSVQISITVNSTAANGFYLTSIFDGRLQRTVDFERF